jgi:NAD(P)-dependent dehydrogenase (short-subunit alcohol dehydrogenase family)
MRLEGKVAVIVGAGQSPGEGIGNGRATTLRFARGRTGVIRNEKDVGGRGKPGHRASAI